MCFLVCFLVGIVSFCSSMHSAVPYSFSFPEHAAITNHIYDPAVGVTAFMFGDAESPHTFYVLDLNQQIFDMREVSVTLHGPNTLIIYNGQMMNVAADRIVADAESTIIFSDVHLELGDDSVLLAHTASVLFHGTCVVHGAVSEDGIKKRLINTSSGYIKIAEHSSLLFHNVAYEHANNVGRFLFVDRTSQLLLRDAEFILNRTSEEPLKLAQGTLVVEGVCSMDAGDGKILMLDAPDNLDFLRIELRPDAEFDLRPHIHSFLNAPMTMEELVAHWQRPAE